MQTAWQVEGGRFEDVEEKEFSKIHSNQNSSGYIPPEIEDSEFETDKPQA